MRCYPCLQAFLLTTNWHHQIRMLHATTTLDDKENKIVIRLDVGEWWTMPTTKQEYKKNKRAFNDGIRHVVAVVHEAGLLAGWRVPRRDAHDRLSGGEQVHNREGSPKGSPPRDAGELAERRVPSDSTRSSATTANDVFSAVGEAGTESLDGVDGDDHVAEVDVGACADV